MGSLRGVHPIKPSLRRAFLIGTSAALALTSTFQPAAAAVTLNVAAGAESSDATVQLDAFAPNAIRVNVGDTIKWTLRSTEFHTVTFLGGAPAPDFIQGGPDGVFANPAAAFPTPGTSYDGTGFANSGLLNKGDSWALTFTKPGTYEFVCIVHPFMKGTVTVGAPGAPADTQAAVDAAIQAEVNGLLANNAVPALASHNGELLLGDGTQPGVWAGASDQTGLAFLPRFFPATVVLHQGDTLTWQWGDPFTPHTVTFLAGRPDVDVIIPQPQPNGPPKLQLNPEVLFPAGDPTAYDGGYLSSGFIDPTMLPPGMTAASFAVTFTRPGTFAYECLLHEGMDGTVVVLP